MPATAIMALSMETRQNSVEITQSFEGGRVQHRVYGKGYTPIVPRPHGPDLRISAPRPILRVVDGKRIVLAGQKSGVLHAVDADNNGKFLCRSASAKAG
jgi:polyvinyl alcohol dehydrogenase (cytochrome)